MFDRHPLGPEVAEDGPGLVQHLDGDPLEARELA